MAIAQACVERWLRRDFKFIREIIDHMDGKAPLRIAGYDGRPLVRTVADINMDRVCGRE